jgi:hypothetical protein
MPRLCPHTPHATSTSIQYLKFEIRIKKKTVFQSGLQKLLHIACVVPVYARCHVHVSQWIHRVLSLQVHQRKGVKSRLNGLICLFFQFTSKICSLISIQKQFAAMSY